MRQLTVISTSDAPAVQDGQATDDLNPDRGQGAGRSWTWALVEVLANAGAAFDPAAALAARRWARLRDEELHHGRR
jgi:hypothetical protein